MPNVRHVWITIAWAALLAAGSGLAALAHDGGHISGGQGEGYGHRHSDEGHDAGGPNDPSKAGSIGGRCRRSVLRMLISLRREFHHLQRCAASRENQLDTAVAEVFLRESLL